MSADERKEPWLDAVLAVLKEGPPSDPAEKHV